MCVALPDKKAVIEAQQEEEKKKNSIEFSMLVLSICDFKHLENWLTFTVEQLTHEDPGYDR